jgi:hypothetical protein
MMTTDNDSGERSMDETVDIQLPRQTKLTDFMCRAAIVECKLVPWGSNYTFAVVMEDPAGEYDDTIGIYKPRAGEAPLWDFPEGTLYQREYASWLVATYLGWDFIPTTVIRDGPHGIGTIQLYIEPEDDSTVSAPSSSTSNRRTTRTTSHSATTIMTSCAVWLSSISSPTTPTARPAIPFAASTTARCGASTTD